MINLPASLPHAEVAPTSTDVGVQPWGTTDYLMAAGPGAKLVWDVNVPINENYLAWFNVILPFGGTFSVWLDGVHIGYDYYSPNDYEGEEETMPARAVTESVHTAPLSGSAPLRLDPTPPTGRYRVRLVNTELNTRVYVARSSADAGASTAEVIEPDFGTWEDYLDSNCQVWIRSSSPTIQPVVRMIQYVMY